MRAYLRRRALAVRSLRFDARRLPHAAVSVAVSACAIVNSPWLLYEEFLEAYQITIALRAASSGQLGLGIVAWAS